MTDETKGDGMTLDKLRDKVAELVGAVACNGSLMQWAVLEINSSIDAHLAAQSAMRVDEAMVERACRAYNAQMGEHFKASGLATPHMMRAALQAAIGGE